MYKAIETATGETVAIKVVRIAPYRISINFH